MFSKSSTGTTWNGTCFIERTERGINWSINCFAGKRITFSSGCFNTLFFSDVCGIYYLISGVLSCLISVLLNYIMSTKCVFNQGNIENKVLEFNLFLAISAIGRVFTEILLWLFTDVLGLYYLISKVIAAVIVMFWNFIARRVMFYGKDFMWPGKILSVLCLCDIFCNFGGWLYVVRGFYCFEGLVLLNWFFDKYFLHLLYMLFEISINKSKLSTQESTFFPIIIFNSFPTKPLMKS